MSFLDTVLRAKTYLEGQGRVSLRALKLEFGLDHEQLEALIEELVDIQQVAAREGRALAWMGGRVQTSEAEPAARSPASTPTPGAEAERRQLTVMFCDLVGSTDLSQRLDAEDLRNVVRAYQESASEVIERYAGHIAQYLGDGLLVYFGYPQAHEDDAERAVRAGREILVALDTLNETLEPQHGIRLAARVGIHTGPVVVGEMGGGAKSETLALGDTTNIAARLEGVAESDSVVISAATLRLVPGMFLTKDLGTRPLKGISEPIRAYAVHQTTGVRSRLDVDPSRLSPLVGRDQEVGLLLERWEQVQEGEGQAVLISGDAGVGKSRLIHALRERMAAEPHSWLECRCTPYTQRSAFHPLIELLEQGLGFLEADDVEAKQRRLVGGVEAAALSVPDVVPLVAPLLSLPLPERYPPLQLSLELQRKKTIEALVAWTLALAEQQPLVMLVEDLHWCDPSTVELLGWLLEQSPTAKVLTLLTFRLDFEPPWPVRSQLTPLALKRLSRRQARNLVSGMTRDGPLPDEVVARIVARADGIPLFVEEVTKMVLESELVEQRDGRYELTGELTELAIPATLKDSLMARLDRLGEGKEVAQLGATLGREFFYELLRSVSLQDEPRLREGLAQLVDADLLYQRGAPPEATYTFKHAMIQDTAYHSLLKRARQQFHARIAHVLEERFPERVESEPEMIARHYDEAGLVAPAIEHYRRAGGRAKQRSANEEAVAHLRRALELLESLPESPERNRQELEFQVAVGAPLSAARGQSHPEVEASFERARQLASQIGDVPELPRVLAGLAASFWIKGDLATSGKMAAEALEGAERTGKGLDLVGAHFAVGVPFYYAGESRRALEHLEQAISLSDRREHASLVHTRAQARIHAGWAHWSLGQSDRALAMTREALALVREDDHPFYVASVLTTAGFTHFLRREPEATRARVAEGIALGERLRLPFFLGLGRAYHGWAIALLREGREGVAEIEQGAAELAGIESWIGAPALSAMLAEGLWKLGRHADAQAAVQRGVAQARRTGQLFYDAELQRLRAEILFDERGSSGAGEAETLLRGALEIARGQEAKALELRVATSLGRLLATRGRRDDARALLAPVYDGFSEGFDTPDLKDTNALLEELA